MILLKHQNLKKFLQKVTLQISRKKFLSLKNLKILCPGLMLLMNLMEKLLEHFTKKDCKKRTNQKEFRIEKVIKRKGGILHVNFFLNYFLFILQSCRKYKLAL